MTTSISAMWIVAEPRNQFRERYRSEITAHNKSQRFLQASENSASLTHPTIGVNNLMIFFSSGKVFATNRLPFVQFSFDIKPNDLKNWFIRVTLVTVKSDCLPFECIHPYRITSEDEKVMKRPSENALFFPITPEDLINGRKRFFLFLQQKHSRRKFPIFSFAIIHYKLTQNELKTVRVLKKLNSSEKINVSLIYSKRQKVFFVVQLNSILSTKRISENQNE